MSYNAIATFNAWLRSNADNSVPFLVEPDEPTKWPSYRVTWFTATQDTRTGGWRALVELAINVKRADTALMRKMADRITEAIGLNGCQEKPRICMKDWSDPAFPVNIEPGRNDSWMEYGFRLGQGWRYEQPEDENARSMMTMLEVFYYGH